MGYRSLRACALDLERAGQLKRIKVEVDPNLEMAEIHRRVFDAGGPALLFERVKGSPFQAISNVYGTIERTQYIFREEIERVQLVTELKVDPTRFLKRPGRYLRAPLTALSALPMRAWGKTPVEYGRTTVDQLPQVVSWPMDGGAFVTLPQVLTEDPDAPGPMGANIGMYRVQLSGNEYVPNREVGMHYQIHRGIGVHHAKYNKIDAPFRCSVMVGGPPSHTFSAIMPLPEGLSEMTFAGMLNDRRYRWVRRNGHILAGDADFIITGTIRKGEKKPEGPFGDHLGYYSLQHDFPVMDVETVYHRKDALWHFTVVGRPPAEDSSFGWLIHKLVERLTTNEFPGLLDVHAVDAAGVHPLLLAVGQERYMPFRERRPEEILTIANHLLGKGQTTLAKFLIIAADDDGMRDCHDIPNFFRHVLERIDWRRDLHFQTNTTIDTLDYSGSGWNAGSKVVMACCGPKLRTLAHDLPKNLTLPAGFDSPRMALPGIMAVSAAAEASVEALATHLEHLNLDGVPMVVIADDAPFVAATLNNFLWVTFTRVNPSHDIHGVHAFTEHKHWGCRGALLLDARIKPHHAPPLVTDPAVSARVDRLMNEIF